MNTLIYVLFDRNSSRFFTENSRWSTDTNKVKILRRHQKARQMRGALSRKNPEKKIEIKEFRCEEVRSL